MLAVVALFAVCPLAEEIATVDEDVPLDVFVPAVAAVDDDACATATAAVLRGRTIALHRAAQKFRRVADSASADAGYFALEAIPARFFVADRTRLRFFHAELLWDLGHYEEAAAHYDVVVDAGASEYRRIAAYNATLALEKVLQGAPVVRPDQNGGVRRPDVATRPPNPFITPLLVRALRRYLEVVPPPTEDDRRAAEERRHVQFKLGYTLLFDAADPGCFAAFEPFLVDDTDDIYGARARELSTRCHALQAPRSGSATHRKPLDRPARRL